MPLGLGNRFAGLKVDDDEDDDIGSKSARTQQQTDTSSKKKKKKRNHEADESLRMMAFGGSKSAGSRQQKQSNQQQRSHNKPARPEEWSDWKKRDEEVTNSMYEQDLQNALLASRLEAEQMKANKEAMKESCRQAGGDSGTGGKKKKKKDKPQAMSLDQFKQLPPETLPGSDDENDEPEAEEEVQVRVPVSSQDKLYFDSVATDASRILQKERIQEQYQKAYAHESAMQSKYQEDIRKLQQRITELESSLEKEKNELKLVKGRNARLCKILADGEMKEKTSILMQMEELTSDKEHLTEQLATLTADLEKERSRNHILKQENDKLKGKHGK